MCGSLRSSTAPRRTFWLESNFAASVLLFKRCASSRSPLQRQAVRRPAACLLYVLDEERSRTVTPRSGRPVHLWTTPGLRREAYRAVAR